MKRAPGHFYGEILNPIELNGLILAETRYSAGYHTPKHSHERFVFCFVRAGSLTDISDRRKRECQPLSLFSHPSGEPHTDVYHHLGARLFVIEIGNRWLARIREHSLALDDPVDFSNGVPTWLAIKLYDEYCNPDEVSPLVIEGLVFELMAAAARCAPGVTELKPALWLEQVREILHTQFAEGLTLSYIAESAGVHPVYLANAFRKHHKCTVGQYVRRLRIEYACREIANSNTPLAEIALAAGFAHQAHFSRTFKKLIGVTPAAYKAQFRKVTDC